MLGNDNSVIVDALDQEKKEISKQIESLKADLKAVDRLLMKYSKEEPQLPIFPDDSINKAIGPTDAIVQLFNTHLGKLWSPAELRDKLNDIKKSGLLITDTKNLLTTVHSVLRIYVKNGSITKDDSGGFPMYTIKNKIQKKRR